MEEFGYEQVVFAPATLAAKAAMEQTGSQLTLPMRGSDEWFNHYMSSGYGDIDPVLLVAPTKRAPFLWKDVEALSTLSPRQRQVMRESREAGLKSGLSIPIHGPQGESYIVSLASDRDGIDPEPHLKNMQILAVQFGLTYARAPAPFEEETKTNYLTERERECLTWTARGKSAWAISKILGVSEHTVNFHLKSAMKKLSTSNRVAAVVLAIRNGLIMP